MEIIVAEFEGMIGVSANIDVEIHHEIGRRKSYLIIYIVFFGDDIWHWDS